jgi:class 3 adenylate cyclase
MNRLELGNGSNRRDASVTAVSGHESANERPPVAERTLAVGGSGLGLIGANPAPVDAGSPPSRVPGPGVDALFDALAEALRIALLSDVQTEGHLRGGPVPENVTLLFSDIVDWTRTANRIGPESADALRRRHFFTLHQAITGTGGTEVKRLGDGTMAVFPTASAALTCAVGMQRGVDIDNRAGDHPLGLRIGLSGGEVTREGSDYFGEPVIEAARLCACASSGEILATRIVKEVAGRRAQYPYRALGPFELKGLPEPRETFEVVWNPTRDHVASSTQSPHDADLPSRHDSSISICEPMATRTERCLT